MRKGFTKDGHTDPEHRITLVAAHSVAPLFEPDFLFPPFICILLSHEASQRLGSSPFL